MAKLFKDKTHSLKAWVKMESYLKESKVGANGALQGMAFLWQGTS